MIRLFDLRKTSQPEPETRRFVMKNWSTLVLVVFVCVSVTMFSGCGGGGSSNPSTPGITSVSQYQGRYSGTFSGDDRGTWNITITANGDISGPATSTLYGNTVTCSGSVKESGQADFSGSGNSGVVFQGDIDSSGNIQGTWFSSYYNMRGTFRGSRVSN